MRFGLVEVFGVIWFDFYLIGYGFNNKNVLFVVFDKGFFFLSVYLGLGWNFCNGCIFMDFVLDVFGGLFYYIYCGWYIVNNYGKIG